MVGGEPMSTLKVNRIEPRTGDTVEIVGFVDDKYFNAYMVSDQVVENSVDTKITFDSVSSDPYSAWSSSNNEYTIPSDGLYMVHSNIGAQDKGSSAGLRGVVVEIYLNGSVQLHGRNSNNLAALSASANISLFSNTLTRVLPLSSGDKISWYTNISVANPDTPSAIFVSGNADHHNSFAWIYKVASL
jgi:hypothetical protein